ncbi:MAG: YifB family Mg chelatase-like AAA ATPase [Capsulimonadaceae bacterium]|nr:YifB family Mg chelatase-like AAA ATPase [Capsulimonadaceae bacterium]
MLATIESSAIMGIDAYDIKVEVDVSAHIAYFAIVGLPDTAVNEAKERVRAAIKNSGLEFPLRRICVNLAPADTKKQGPSFDLPVAIGILAATGQVLMEGLDDWLFVGELALDGGVRPVAGILPIAVKARQDGVRKLVVPAENAEEAAIVGDVEVYPVTSLLDAVALLNDRQTQRVPVTADPIALLSGESAEEIDFSEVKGQEHVKRAMEVAAAGGHNLLLVGPPGSGKSMLARRLPSILAPMTLDEALEATKIYSVSGQLSAVATGGHAGASLIARRPFRSPHHTISTAGLTGGGSIPRPGEVSLAHNGVLFLDELPEFRRDVLEVMRQPLEDGQVTIARVSASLTYPAKFTLCAAMNPCLCGFYGDPVRECTCTPNQIKAYLQRISGPLLDRIDIHIEVPRLKSDELVKQGDGKHGESSAVIRERVVAARKIQEERFKKLKSNGAPLHCNAHMQSRHIHQFCKVTADVSDLLRKAITQLSLSARAYDRILKLARTIADLDAKDDIQLAHVAEALQYRALDRKLWG